MDILCRNYPRYKREYEELLRPINIKLGILKSDFRKGLSKFFNKNTYDAGVAVFGQLENDSLKKAILEILAEPDSYCLRERLSRETEGLKQSLQKKSQNEAPSPESEIALKIITIFMKKIPNYLVQPHNYSIVHFLKEKWIELSELSLDSFTTSNLINIRKMYTKIQACLLSYCKHPKANMRVFFDLIKGYKYQSLIDQTDIKLFFAKEIPEKFSTEKKIEMMRLALEKINNGSKDEKWEIKYMFFELGFMPIIIHHAEDSEFFD